MCRNFLLIGWVILLVSGCKQGIDSETYNEYITKGNEITNQAQATLLSNVAGAMQKGGTQYAVEFCNLEASDIIDSLNHSNNCVISRVSAKNRNPENNLKSEREEALWSNFTRQPIKDTLLVANGKYVYYKRIVTGMPACLKCHGVPEADINTATIRKLNELYPNDLARGYQLNDFRGLWKVEFEIN